MNWNCKESVLREVKKNGNLLKCASETLKNDKDIVLSAVQNDGYALEYASEELKNDKDVVLKAVQKSSYVLQFASEILRDDREIVLQAVKEDGCSLKFASETLKNDKKIVSCAFKRCDESYKRYGVTLIKSVLSFLPKTYHNDRKISLLVVKQNEQELFFTSRNLKKDRSFLFQVTCEDIFIDGIL